MMFFVWGRGRVDLLIAQLVEGGYTNPEVVDSSPTPVKKMFSNPTF